MSLDRAWWDIHASMDSQTNSDGRCPTLLPEGYKAEKGIYRVTFETKAFFSKIGQECFYPYVQVSISVGLGKQRVPKVLTCHFFL